MAHNTKLVHAAIFAVGLTVITVGPSAGATPPSVHQFGEPSGAAVHASTLDPAGEPKAIALKCTTASPAELAGAVGGVPRGSLTPVSEVVSGDAESDVVFTQPLGGGAAPGHLEFRVFLTRYSEPSAADWANTRPGLNVLRVQHPPAATQVSAANAASTDTQSDYGLHLYVPDQRVTELRQRRFLYVVACEHDGGKDTLVAWASHRVGVSARSSASLVGIALMLAVYLCSATWVWFKRKQEAHRATNIVPVAPLRVTTVTSWSWLRCLDPVAMTSDSFDRASLSKLQILFFVMLVGFGVTYSLIRTGSLSDLSTSIVFLLGIPALGALGNQVAGASRDRLSLDNWAWLVSHGIIPINDPGHDEPRWTDLVMTETELNLYKLQALTFSVIVGGAMIVSGFSDLAKFVVPPTMLQILGLSQFVFFGGQLAKPANLGDLDDLLTELRKRIVQFRVAASVGIDVDASGGLSVKPDPAKPASAVLDKANASARIPVALGRYKEVADEVRILVESLSHRDIKAKVLADPFNL